MAAHLQEQRVTEQHVRKANAMTLHLEDVEQDCCWQGEQQHVAERQRERSVAWVSQQRRQSVAPGGW